MVTSTFLGMPRRITSFLPPRRGNLYLGGLIRLCGLSGRHLRGGHGRHRVRELRRRLLFGRERVAEQQRLRELPLRRVRLGGCERLRALLQRRLRLPRLERLRRLPGRVLQRLARGIQLLFMRRWILPGTS